MTATKIISDTNPKDRKNITDSGLLSAVLYIEKNIPTAEVNENKEIKPTIYLFRLLVFKNSKVCSNILF